MSNKKKVLHIGCGPEHILGSFGFDADSWEEVRLDINPDCKPDILGTMTDLSSVTDSSFDAVYSSHNIEHIYPHEVPIALKEFLRVLNNDGILLITCPDLQNICKHVAEDHLADAFYHTAIGVPIAPIDMLYGYRLDLALGKTYMAHKCGFTSKVLRNSIQAAGFKSVATLSHQPSLALFAVATKQQSSQPTLEKLFNHHWISFINKSRIPQYENR